MPCEAYSVSFGGTDYGTIAIPETVEGRCFGITFEGNAFGSNATDADSEVTAAIGELNYSGSLNIPASTNADLFIRSRVVGGGFVELSLTVPDGLLVLSIYFA